MHIIFMKYENVSTSSVPVNYGDANHDPLFPYGFGSTY